MLLLKKAQLTELCSKCPKTDLAMEQENHIDFPLLCNEQLFFKSENNTEQRTPLCMAMLQPLEASLGSRRQFVGGFAFSIGI